MIFPFVVLALFLTFSSASLAQSQLSGWKQVGSMHSDGIEARLFIDLSSVQGSSDMISVWTKTDIVQDAPRLLSIQTKIQIQCSNRLYRDSEIRIFDKNGNILESVDFVGGSSAGWRPIEPDKRSELVAREIC